MPVAEMLNRLGTVYLEEIDPPKGQNPEVFVAYMTKAPIPVAGYGGWSRVARPRRKALTEWVGRDSMSIEIEFLVDVLGEPEGEWVEKNIRSLERFGGIDQGDPEPPLFRLRSEPDNMMPHGYGRASHVKWFLDSLSWDKDSAIVSTSGNRIRLGGTMTVTQYVKDERLSPSKARKHGNAGKNRKGSKRKSYTVKAGDTLLTIAARKDVYGDATRWKRIAKANKIRDPRHLKVGRHLRIP